MTFEIDFKGRNYSYDLGQHETAKEACRGLEIYKKHYNYGDLRRIFANLSWAVYNGNPNNEQACLATRILALSVFPTLNRYQKLFVAISVTSIYQKAEYPIPADWKKAMEKYGSIVSKSSNQEAMLDAGLACVDSRSGETLVQPIPEYSVP